MNAEVKVEIDRNGNWRNKRCVSIEQLLWWAYNSQKVHKALSTPVATKLKLPTLAKASTWSTCAPIDASLEHGFRAASDAWIVHQEVMKLECIVVDCGHDLAASRYHGLAQFRGAEPPIGRIEDRGRSARHWPTDGILELDMRMLVGLHASQVTRPVKPGVPEMRIEPGETVWHPKRKTKVYSKGWFSHVTVVGEMPGEILESLVTYKAWWLALDGLRQQLSPMCLTMFSITNSMPPEIVTEAVG